MGADQDGPRVLVRVRRGTRHREKEAYGEAQRHFIPKRELGSVHHGELIGATFSPRKLTLCLRKSHISM